MSEAPERVWDPIPPAKVYVSIRLLPEEDDYEFEFAIEPSGNKKEYVRVDIAEAEKKVAVREFANRFTYEFDQRYKGNVALYELDKIHDLVTQLLNEATQ